MESLFAACCVENQDLNRREQKYYTKFVNQMIKDYDPTSDEHERNLARFYTLVFGEAPDLTVKNEYGVTMVDEKWKDLGFQGKNPRTDFRGGGHLSLLCLIYMRENYRAEFERLTTATKEQQELMWLTAISSINLTHSLAIYLHMHEGEVAP